MSTPTPDRSQWSVTVTVPSDLPASLRDSLFGRVANAAHLWEPSTRDGWDVDVSAGPTASAPQGDTTPEDVIEQARGIAYRALADAPRTRPDGKRFGSIAGDRVRADAVIDAFAAAGLLAVAASPAVPQARERGELWNILDWSLWGNGMADTFRDPLADKMIAALTDAEYEQATALIERWKRLRGDQAYRKLYEDQRAEIERLKALSAPAPADDEAAQVERMAAAIAKDDGFDWRSGEWNDVYLSRARAALAALKEGQQHG